MLRLHADQIGYYHPAILAVLSDDSLLDTLFGIGFDEVTKLDNVHTEKIINPEYFERWSESPLKSGGIPKASHSIRIAYIGERFAFFLTHTIPFHNARVNGLSG